MDPWISTDIEKGSRWTPELSEKLESSKIGIICLTRENLNEKWILFEAGALSKIQNTKVCTFLLGLTPADVEPPLSQFQHTVFQKEDFFKLLQTINLQVDQVNEKSLTDKTLNSVFERCWPEFENEIKKIVSQLPEKKKQIRTDREILEEILELVRRSEDNNKSKYNLFISDEFKREIIKKILRLVNEFDVDPSEAKRSVLNEMKKELDLSDNERAYLREIIFKLEIDFNQSKEVSK